MRVLPLLLAPLLLGLLPSPPSQPAAPTTVVLKGRLIDGTGAAPIEQGLIILQGDEVQYAGPAVGHTYPAGARIIDAGTGTILPGLIDLHAHLRPQYWGNFLPAGITTVRDANNSLNMLRELATAPAPHPRLYYTGPLLDGPNTVLKQFFPDSLVERYVRPATAGPVREVAVLLVRTPAEARAAVDSVAAHGATFVKLYEQLSPEAYRAAADQARRRHLRVMTDLGMLETRGLSGAQVDALQALAAGVQSIEHASGYALAYQRLGGDPQQPLDTRLVDQLARATVRKRTALVPTLTVYYGTTQPDSARQQLRVLPAGQLLPDYMVAMMEQQGAHPSTKHQAHAAADLRLAQALTRRVYELGGRIGAGSDTPAGDYNLPGGSLHRELALLVEAGLPPVAALRAATGAAGELLGQPRLGTLRPHSPADVLIVAGNPAANIRATRQVRYVLKAGQVVIEPKS